MAAVFILWTVFGAATILGCFTSVDSCPPPSLFILHTATPPMTLLRHCWLSFCWRSSRLPYLLEGHLHHLVGPVVYDDTWHFQEINSLVHSVAVSCSLQPDPHSIFFAVLRPLDDDRCHCIWQSLIHGFTIKAAFAIGCAIYQILLCMTLLYIGIARTRTSETPLLGDLFDRLLGWHGILFFCDVLSSHAILSGCWRRIRLSIFRLSLPAFFGRRITRTAAVALILCWHSVGHGGQEKLGAIAACSVLLAFAFYSSVFVFLGALPFAAYYVLRTARTNFKGILVVCCISSVALIWPLLWIYLGKESGCSIPVPFIKGIRRPIPVFRQWVNLSPCIRCFSSAFTIFHGMSAGFLVFLAFYRFDFLLHAIALMFYGKSLAAITLSLLRSAILFIVSTYFVGFPEGDNYASRGYMIPILVLGWICAQILPEIRPRPWIVLGLLLGSFGLFHEGFSTFKHAIYIARTPVSPTYGAAISGHESGSSYQHRLLERFLSSLQG